MSYEYTTRGHLVGVVSNGTAVLGLGDIGADASKPVMVRACVRACVACVVCVRCVRCCIAYVRMAAPLFSQVPLVLYLGRSLCKGLAAFVRCHPKPQ